MEILKRSELDIFNRSSAEATDQSRRRKEVPIWQKGLLTLEEASEYTGIGVNKLRDMSNARNCEFVLWNGTKRMLKRKKLDDYLDSAYSI